MRALALMLCYSAAFADTTVGVSGGSPILRAEVTPKGRVSELQLVDGERILWRRPPPQPVTLAKVRNTHATVETLGLPFLLTRSFPNAIAVALWERLWIFDRADGHTLIDEQVSAQGFGGINVDSATVTIDGKCPTHIKGAVFFAECAQTIVYARGVGITVTRGDKLLGSYMYPDVTPIDADGSYRFTVGGVTIAIRPH